MQGSLYWGFLHYLDLSRSSSVSRPNYMSLYGLIYHCLIIVIFNVFRFLLEHRQKPIPFVLVLLGFIFQPLQGVFNILVQYSSPLPPVCFFSAFEQPWILLVESVLANSENWRRQQ